MASNLDPTVSAASETKDAASNLVWPSVAWNIGPFATGITTRGLYDFAVMGAAIFFAIIGIMFLVKPDLQKLFSTAIKAAPEAAAVGAV